MTTCHYKINLIICALWNESLETKFYTIQNHINIVHVIWLPLFPFFLITVTVHVFYWISMGTRPEPNVQCHVCKLYILLLHAFSFNCGCRSGLAGGTLKLMATPLPPWGSLLMWLSTRLEGQTPHWPRTWPEWLSKTRLQTMKALMVYLTCI